MTQNELFFFEESVRHARTLSYQQCLSFLRGLLFAVGEHPGAGDLRTIIRQMSASDAQLELIQIGQLRFETNGVTHTKGPEGAGK
jgi:hypothetical protein